MSLKKAKELYQSLSPQQKSFVDKKTTSITFPVSKWLAFLNKASKYDHYGDLAIKTLSKRFGWFLALTIISFVLGFILLVPFLFVPVFLVLTIVSHSKRKAFRGRDLNNYFREFFYPFVEVMRDKAGDDARLSATLDFRDPRKSQQPQESKVNNRNLKRYLGKYISAKIKLKDEAILDFVIQDDLMDFSYWKTSASGKRKHKKKSKIVHSYIIKLTVPKKSYAKADASTAVNIDIQEIGETIVIKYKGKHKVAVAESVLPLQQFFGAIQEMYSCLEGLHATKKPRNDDDDVDGDDYDDDYVEVYDDGILPMMMWHGGYFDNYDYDSFDHSDTGGELGYNDEEGTSVFDS